MDEYEPDLTPHIIYQPVYTLFRDEKSPRAAVIRHQRHRANYIVAVCSTEEAARAALRLMLLETNHAY